MLGVRVILWRVSWALTLWLASVAVASAEPRMLPGRSVPSPVGNYSAFAPLNSPFETGAAPESASSYTRQISAQQQRQYRRNPYQPRYYGPATGSPPYRYSHGFPYYSSGPQHGGSGVGPGGFGGGYFGDFGGGLPLYYGNSGLGYGGPSVGYGPFNGSGMGSGPGWGPSPFGGGFGGYGYGGFGYRGFGFGVGPAGALLNSPLADGFWGGSYTGWPGTGFVSP